MAHTVLALPSDLTDDQLATVSTTIIELNKTNLETMVKLFQDLGVGLPQAASATGGVFLSWAVGLLLGVGAQPADLHTLLDRVIAADREMASS